MRPDGRVFDALHEAGLEETASRMEQSDFLLTRLALQRERMLQRAIDVDGFFSN